MTAAPTDRIVLATWPTPLESAPRLAEAIGLRATDLWIKRDDLTGLAGGGNKIRKLEWTLAAAVAEGADTVITTGAPQSNHARLTAAAAARLGLHAVLVFPGRPPSRPEGNLILDGLLGATVVWAGDDPDGDTSPEDVADRLREEGRRPSIVPFGGSNAVGAHGYRLAGHEILDQRATVDHVVCAVGSGGTMAGLVAALGAPRVLGVDTGAVADPYGQVGGLLADMGEDAPATALRIRTDQVGEGYGTLTAGARAALSVAARTDGLVLDPTYTARALAGLIREVDDGIITPGQTVVFLASGGLPGLFGHPDAASLAGDPPVGSEDREQ
ncbi:pyridoxal-phosphate dependent enzyme [Mycolicibacterium sediminis]|uniref:D-cysteine desulfhydrase n=1 Tax=Mycolicibacterium sediminis TaxID=1286180 RepID=A0A7I7QKY0_9MYCO|nr:pyridoxal-phosphate dependent enzyme [Mycolicibacterium sediminis]BBY26951.1 D-cysteine desulfhydrase [Mycolicibacterium sediminis]